MHPLIINTLARVSRSSSLVTLLRLPLQSSLKITDHSFLFNCGINVVLLSVFLMSRLRQSSLPFSDSDSRPVVYISHGVFHSRLKTHLFSKSFPPQPSISPTDAG